MRIDVEDAKRVCASFTDALTPTKLETGPVFAILRRRPMW